MSLMYLIDWDTIIAAFVLIGVGIAQMKFHIRELMLRRPRLYGYASLVITAIATIYVFGDTQINTNMIIASSAGSGHLFSVVVLFCVFYVTGFGDAMGGILTAGVFYAIHETISIFGIFASSLIYGIIVNGSVVPFGTVVMFYASSLVFFFGIAAAYSMTLGARDWRAINGTIVISAVFSLFVLIANFQGTVNVGGATSQILNPDAILVEVLSWAMPATYFILNYRRRGTTK